MTESILVNPMKIQSPMNIRNTIHHFIRPANSCEKPIPANTAAMSAVTVDIHEVPSSDTIIIAIGSNMTDGNNHI
jgi:hypothetical protein